ncbi:MAG: Cation-transporting P-type ATPase [candidate division TM6 bacterium GW2011_GWE2_42_60]|nr:MAG: Cation-transporting P-type ATPase [candidate division TM6 bacterium GW2011_GWE2_42_60]HBY06176.1 hypothetical protein [Candidatus Dependentiae bacterium]
MKKQMPYAQTVKEILKTLAVSPENGLSLDTVRERKERYGLNDLPHKPPRSFVSLVFDQFNNAFSYLLVIAAFLKLFIEGYRDALFIFIVVIVSAIVSAFQEGRASKILEKLRSFVRTECVVLRDGHKYVINQTELVPGDIIILLEGNRIPADARLIESSLFKVDESALTGESTLVLKNATSIIDHEVPLFDQKNMVFMGTTVMMGHAKAVVVATGMDTQLGTLHAPLSRPEMDMPLKRDLKKLSKFLLIAACSITLFFIIIGYLVGKDINELIFTMTSLLVSIVPQSIPIVSTIIMAQNAFRMAQVNVLVKKLQAIDALGRVQVLVVDKTGTLTKNEQIITTILTDDTTYRITGSGYQSAGEIWDESTKIIRPSTDSQLHQSAIGAALLDSSEITIDQATEHASVRGEPLQAALGVFAAKAGINKAEVQKMYDKLDEIPFDTTTRLHLALFQKGTEVPFLFALGAPEAIEKLCSPHDTGKKEGSSRLLAEGYRVLALALREAPGETTITGIQKGFTCLGLFGMSDTLRSDAAEAISDIKKLGVHVVVATGDHPITAFHVAQQIGLNQPLEAIVEGKHLSALSDTELQNTSVLARVTPQDKLSIVERYHQAGFIVGMTGDGVNDVPALALSEVGIALGRMGTDFAKEAANIILLDDALSTIKQGILLGRHAFAVMRRVLLFVLATSGGEVFTLAFALFLNLPLPLLATQILWIHMLTDGLLDIALGMEPPDYEELQKPIATQAVVDRSLARIFILTSLPIALATLSLFWWFWWYSGEGLIKARTVALTVLAMCQWWNAWNCRSEKKSLFALRFFGNRWLLILTGLVAAAQYAAISWKPLQNMLSTTSLSWSEIGLCFSVSTTVLVVDELRKFFTRIE